MRTREDVIRHFTYVPPRPETEVPAKAVHRAISSVEDFVGWCDNCQLPAVTLDGMRTSHMVFDETLRNVALVVFDTLPEVPDRTAALRTLWLARGLGHRWLDAHNAVRKDREDRRGVGLGAPSPDTFTLDAERRLRDAVLVRLAEVRIQAIGAIVMATP